MSTLCNIYHAGRGVEVDYGKSNIWGEKALAIEAGEHLPYLLCTLGYQYYHGFGVPVDYAKAYDYLSRSAELGNSNAMYKTGDMFYFGIYVEEDKTTAYQWYVRAKKSAYESDVLPNIQYRIGRCLLYGHGIEKDVLKALSQLQKAEIGLIRQITNGELYADRTLPQVVKEIETARALVYDLAGISIAGDE